MTSDPRILAAVDFSDASARAVAVAGFITEACHGKLTLLHAESIDAPPYFTSEQLERLERERRAGRAAAQAAVERFGREHTPTACSAVVVDDTPVQAILQASATADLIVMGTQGRHGLARWWLGSVAERAIHALPKPLLVVRAEVPHPVESLLARIVVLAERRGSGAQMLEYARSLAARRGGTVFDERGAPIEQALERNRSTLAIVPAPQPGNALDGKVRRSGRALLRCAGAVHARIFGRSNVMTVEPMLRLIAGAFVSASVLLGVYVHPAFLWFTLFVGLNLFQSALTRWCPLMAILRRAGVPDQIEPPRRVVT